MGIVPDATAVNTSIVQICQTLRNRSRADIGGASDVCAIMIILEKTNENGIPGILRDLQAHDMTRQNIRPRRIHSARKIFAKDGTAIPISDGDIRIQHGQPSGRSDEETLAAEPNARSNLAIESAAYCYFSHFPGSSPP